MNIEDYLEDIAFWIMIPTIRLTENYESKTVRVLGVLLAFLFSPLILIGGSLLFLSMIIGMYREI